MDKKLGLMAKVSGDGALILPLAKLQASAYFIPAEASIEPKSSVSFVFLTNIPKPRFLVLGKYALIILEKALVFFNFRQMGRFNQAFCCPLLDTSYFQHLNV
jgi:hypothetical protein